MRLGGCKDEDEQGWDIVVENLFDTSSADALALRKEMAGVKDALSRLRSDLCGPLPSRKTHFDEPPSELTSCLAHLRGIPTTLSLLIELGVEEAGDLLLLEEEDLARFPPLMKKIPAKKLHRAVAAAKGGAEREGEQHQGRAQAAPDRYRHDDQFVAARFVAQPPWHESAAACVVPNETNGANEAAQGAEEASEANEARSAHHAQDDSRVAAGVDTEMGEEADTGENSKKA